jgi:hypothetical protein
MFPRVRFSVDFVAGACRRAAALARERRSNSFFAALLDLRYVIQGGAVVHRRMGRFLC